MTKISIEEVLALRELNAISCASCANRSPGQEYPGDPCLIAAYTVSESFDQIYEGDISMEGWVCDFWEPEQ